LPCFGDRKEKSGLKRKFVEGSKPLRFGRNTGQGPTTSFEGEAGMILVKRVASRPLGGKEESGRVGKRGGAKKSPQKKKNGASAEKNQRQRGAVKISATTWPVGKKEKKGEGRAKLG